MVAAVWPNLPPAFRAEIVGIAVKGGFHQDAIEVKAPSGGG